MRKVSSQQNLKFINQQKVLNLIYNQTPISRVEIAERTALTQQTVTNIVNRLMEDDLVVEGKPIAGAKGRNPIPLAINADKLYAIGIEVAIKYIRGKLIDFQKKVIAEFRIDDTGFENSEDTFECVRKVVYQLVKEVPKKGSLKGIGISLQALVDSKNGIVIYSPGLEMKDFPLVEKLKEEFDFPIYIENDVNLVAIIENEKGRLIDSENNIVLKLDHGIGGAIMNHKQIFVGASNVAGEFGHIKAFTGTNRYSCICGSAGCLTTLASASGLLRNKGLTLDEFSANVQAADSEANQDLNTIADAVGRALSNVVTFLNPDRVLLVGKVIEKLGDRFVPQVVQIVNETVLYSCKDVSIIHMIEPLDESMLAAELVIKKHFEIPLELLSL
ncbi:ROK family transcriptional regulator [Neobacillus niacini]|uniref:ROK family transcriptional regulator n=1 Tax=Neobacillus niacini TaxID=86668 RepID=UPI002FFFC913